MQRLKCNHCGEWTVNPPETPTTQPPRKRRSPWTSEFVFDPIMTSCFVFMTICSVALFLGY